MTDNAPQHEHEQTIEPIRPGFAEKPAAARSAFEPVETSNRQSLKLAAGGLALVAGLVVVFFALPRWMEEEAQQPAPAPPDVVSDEVSTPVPTLSAERIAELEAQIQRDLARLLTQQEDIESLSVEIWGGELWDEYQELSRGGDDAYLDDDYEAAALAYAEALTTGESLIAEAGRIVTEAMADGQAALDAADWRTALTEFNVVLSIEPEHAAAAYGKERAENLPAVLDLMSEAAQYEDSGELPAAIEAYRAALAIDRDWRPARTALTEAEGNLEQYEFDQVLSSGFAALGEGDYRDAIEYFDTALEMRSDSSLARDGLFQAEEGLRLGQIALAEIRALAFERRELWPEAIEQYRGALATDATLQYAIDGLARSQARQDLDVKLLNIIENPRLLFDDQVLTEARALLTEANQVPEPGARIREQAADLGRLIDLASTPLRVELHSDAQTEVTVFRVGTLGTFTATEIEVRPGEYTAVGSRNGYRDVRMRFTVLPGRELEPIRIVCVDPI